MKVVLRYFITILGPVAICDNYWSMSTNDAIIVSKQPVHDSIQAVGYCQVNKMYIY